MKTVKLWSSTLLRGHKSVNLSVLNSKKVAFLKHESQKVASNINYLGSEALFITSEVYLLLLSEWDKLTVFEGQCLY